MLQELLAITKDEDILKRLLEIYPDQKKNIKGYKEVLKKLRTMEPAPQGKMKIFIDHVIDDLDKDDIQTYDRVSGVEDGNDTCYAIEFVPWKEWLSMEIHPDTTKYPDVDIIVHCLWEMTWSGFEEEEIQDTIKKLNETVKEIKKSGSYK